MLLINGNWRTRATSFRVAFIHSRFDNSGYNTAEAYNSRFVIRIIHSVYLQLIKLNCIDSVFPFPGFRCSALHLSAAMLLLYHLIMTLLSEDRLIY